MNEPVTWLMPVKNGMPYLPLTLNSIANQTYRNHRIIAWDNGSIDGTIEELRRWIPGRIPGIVITDRAMRMGACLAALVETAQTELCARVDADDIHSPKRLEIQVAHMLAHPQVAALGSQVLLIDSQGRPTGRSWVCPLDDAEVRWRTRWQSGLAHPSVLFRRSAILRAGNYADVQSEDCELWIRLSAIGEIYSLPETLVSYRRHEASESGGYTDFYPGQLRSARNAVRHLFPNLTPLRALALWELTHPVKIDQPEPVTLQQFFQFSRAATLLARQCRKPDSYFKETPTYRSQYYWLRRKIFRRYGLLKLADFRHNFRRRASELRDTTVELPAVAAGALTSSD